MDNRGYYKYGRGRDEYYCPKTNDADFHPIDELLRRQRKGEFLTKGEKDRVVAYGEKQRRAKKNKN